jgi:hypothetical protein
MPASSITEAGGSTEEISTVDLLSAITNNSAKRCAGYSAK